ncbi:helix-turn-helix domain-containing protein [Achromobacter agilis]|uniref:Transcriptional activator NphR n=1 Tax=Achromobacter agilis TaxID=1353888 RepID=A0A446CYG7_9BURK|nr:helix-turn-helix domain-containing protein [Achromobacter agilis]SSW72867.1 Transcriptional activator NphR [Achromobacter agilis]
MKLNYSTEKVSERQRPEYWNEVVCKHCVQADSTIDSSGSFIGQYAAKSIDEIEISRMSSPRHVWQRAARHVRRDANEAFLLTLMESGTGQLSQSGRSTQINNGDIALYDAERLFTYDMTPESVLLLRIPRKQLLYRAPLAERYTAMRFIPDKPITGLLFHTIRSAADINFSEDLPPGVQTQFAASLLDLLAATIQMQMAGSDSASSEREKLLGSAKQYVESHLDDPQLTVDRIAIALRVSERTLTRMFAESGTTPMRWVWQRRLEAAYCSLKEGRARQVTEAAFRNGFNDVSHFSRIFKLCYGHSPKDLLSRTRR